MLRDALNIGLVEDDPVMGGSIAQRLEIEGYQVNWWKSAGEAIASTELDRVDIVVCDIRLPDMNGEELFRQVYTRGPTLPFLFITGYGQIDQAVRLMRLGAADYMTKPFAFDEFLLRLRQNARSRKSGTDEPGILGRSPEMIETEKLARKYAKTNLPVLITGETGVGKEVTAHFVHSVSATAAHPFIAVNCAAIPAELLESEIFGHERGAFTGAAKRHIGYAERAGEGSLFLDEIGDMPVELQAKILRLIEENLFYRLGGEEPVPFKARVIAATHRDLSKRSEMPGFREDLYFRLSVLPLNIQPLRDRPDDIVALMDALVTQASERQDKPIRGFSSLAEELALSHPWPGNVRELRNRIERAVAVSAGEWLMPEDLFPDISGASNVRSFSSLSEIRDAAEKRQIERALSRTSGHITKAARLLDVSRTTLWEKMTRFGIEPGSRSES